MTYINITKFVLNLSFVLSEKIINIWNDIPRKYGNVTVEDFRKYGKARVQKE